MQVISVYFSLIYYFFFKCRLCSVATEWLLYLSFVRHLQPKETDDQTVFTRQFSIYIADY